MKNYQTDRVEQKLREIEQTIPEQRQPTTFQQLEAAVDKWLLINDRGLLKVLLASVIANRLQGDPVWLFIVTASGGTKTELIRGLNKVPDVYGISDLTPQTFLSGDRQNKNASLLLRLPQFVILTMKDFTTVLTMHRDKRHAILSQLREIYDGYYRKEFGTGETRTWEGKWGFIAGVTSIIDHHQSIFQVLGERFVQYRPTQAEDVALAKKAMGNSGGEKAMRLEIQNALVDYLAGVQIPPELPALPEAIKECIAHLAAFCVRARSGVVRDGHTREIELIPETELPTRLAKQLSTLYSALTLIDNASSKDNFALIAKIGMDSLPKKRKQVIDKLIKADDWQETADIAMAIGYPTGTTRHILEDLHGLGITDRQHEGQGYADHWRITEKTRHLLEKALPESLHQQHPEKPLPTKENSGVPEMSAGQTNLDISSDIPWPE